MTDKVQKIREEVEKIARSINPYIPDEEGKNSEYEAGRFAMVTQIMQIIDSLQQEEPVSEDLEEAAQEYVTKEGYLAGLHYNSMVLSFKTGAEWQKIKDESCSKDLGEYINELSKQFPEVSFAKLSRIAVHVAKWQLNKIKE